MRLRLPNVVERLCYVLEMEAESLERLADLLADKNPVLHDAFLKSSGRITANVNAILEELAQCEELHVTPSARAKRNGAIVEVDILE